MNLFYKTKWHLLCSDKQRKKIWEERWDVFNKLKSVDLINKTTLSNEEKIEMVDRIKQWKERDKKLYKELFKGEYLYYPRFLTSLYLSLKNNEKTI